MWLILSCGEYCDTQSLELARSSNWNAEAAIVGFLDPEMPTMRYSWFPTSFDDVPEGARFATQLDCLRALRRAMPEHETRRPYTPDGEGWELHSVTHERDYISKFAAVGWVEGRANMVRSYYTACFQESPRVG